MRNCKRILRFAAALLLGAAIPAFGLWGRFPDDKPIEIEDWPQEILRAINEQKRVYGAGSYQMGWRFYFKGDTKGVNTFLAKVAEEKGVVLEVVLVPEAGDAKPDPFQRDLQVAYDWAIRLYLYGDHVLIQRREGEEDAQYQKRSEAERAALPKYGAEVTIHCSGAVDPNTLKIPLAFKASMGGRLAELVELHNRRRTTSQTAGKEFDRQPPTQMPSQEPKGIFKEEE